MKLYPLRWLLLLVTLLPACATTSPPAPGSGACTTLGCVNGYSIDLSASSWPAGKYEIDLLVDGKAGKCEAQLPLTEGARASCTLPEVRLELSGSALPPQQHAIAGLVWSSQPAKIEVTVKVNGTTLGKPASLTPSYKKMQPNGPDCEPTCTGARDTLTL